MGPADQRYFIIEPATYGLSTILEQHLLDSEMLKDVTNRYASDCIFKLIKINTWDPIWDTWYPARMGYLGSHLGFLGTHDTDNFYMPTWDSMLDSNSSISHLKCL